MTGEQCREARERLDWTCPELAEKAPGLRARNYRKRQGRCYELACKYLIESDDAAQWTLVHGDVGNVGTNPVFGHAWLERRDAVYDAISDKFFSKAEFYLR